MNAAARALGMERGARVTDMRALVPDLSVEDASPEEDAADLTRLARWARRWCPWTQEDGADGLLLDVTGSAHLFGGEAAMLADMARAFAAAGLTIRAAAAPTVGAAWALTRHGGRSRTVCADDEVAARLAPLPVAALRLDSDTVLLLKRLGLKSIGDLSAVPREALVRRFRKVEAPAANPVLRLDQAAGRLAEPMVPGRTQAPLRAVRRMAEPIGDLAGIETVLGDLLADLVRRLGEAERGVRRLVLTGYRVDGSAQSLGARTSTPSRDPAHLARLFAEDLPRLDPGFGFDAMELEAAAHEAMAARQDGLGGEDGGAARLAELVDRLMARLGADGVQRLEARGSHVPERAEEAGSLSPPARGSDRCSASGSAAKLRAGQRPAPSLPLSPRRGERAYRPFRLLARAEEANVLYAVPDGPPARMTWRRQGHRIVKAEGPERIAPEWWREKSGTRLRDYYRVEDETGRRYWLYREGLPGDGRGGAPRWFVQGMHG